MKLPIHKITPASFQHFVLFKTFRQQLATSLPTPTNVKSYNKMSTYMPTQR